ncbi:MAG: hypothetical protein IIZ97_02325 [Prevotella sp.]|nr:hypothetical protein [Prevotella sp.]
MPKIDKQIIDRILEVARIEEVIGDVLGTYDRTNPAGLKKQGVRYEALCPFHADKSMGSFIVYPKGNCYKCFSCGAKGGVIDFLMEHEKLSYPDAIRWLGKKYNIDVDNVDVNWTYTPRPAPPPLELLELPESMVTGTYRAICVNGVIVDNLVNWMTTGIRWDYIQRKRLAEVLHNYHVGHGKNGHTIFWQIDEQGRVRTGKMMKYKPDGHRDKEGSWNFDFIHSVLSRTFHDNDPWPYPHIFNPDKQEARLTFFGMHLLNHFPNAAIKIVESEKTALLMATAYGNHSMQLWMACGGLEMITRERLQPLLDQHRRIILYPDRDGIEKWQQKAEQMHYSHICVDTEPVTKWWKPEDGEKADIGDVVVRILNQSAEMTSIGEVAEKVPQFKPIIDNLNLKIDND